MNSRDVGRVFDVLLRIDAGEPVPRLAGTPGAFFRRYAAERDAVVRLALKSGVLIRKDGKLSGASVGTLTIGPVAPELTHWASRTHWGEVDRFLVLCPELLTIAVLRIWLSAASGREAVRTLLTASDDDTVRAAGDFRWSPPGAVTTGTADFELGAGDVLAQWTTAPYIKATADDLLAPMHPLDLRDVYVAHRPLLAQFRCVLLRPLTGGRVLVVGGLRSQPLELQLAGLAGLSIADRNLMTDTRGPVLALVCREAWSQQWKALLVAPADSKQALRHILSWAEYMRALDPGFGRQHELEAAGRQSLGEAGIRPPTEGIDIVRVSSRQDVPLARLALELNRRIRVGGAVSREGFIQS
jgi:hypothetical protein